MWNCVQVFTKRCLGGKICTVTPGFFCLTTCRNIFCIKFRYFGEKISGRFCHRSKNTVKFGHRGRGLQSVGDATGQRPLLEVVQYAPITWFAFQPLYCSWSCGLCKQRLETNLSPFTLCVWRMAGKDKVHFHPSQRDNLASRNMKLAQSESHDIQLSVDVAFGFVGDRTARWRAVFWVVVAFLDVILGSILVESLAVLGLALACAAEELKTKSVVTALNMFAVFWAIAELSRWSECSGKL